MISVVTNITLEPHLTKELKKRLAALQSNTDVQMLLYEDIRKETGRLIGSELVVVIPYFGALYPDWSPSARQGNSSAQLVRQAVTESGMVYDLLKSSVGCPVIWFGYENEDCFESSVFGNNYLLQAPVEEINLGVREFIEENDIYIDTRRLIALVGTSNAFDQRSKYRWNAPYSKQMIEAIVDEICTQFMICHGMTKKCLVLDCDGVLWGGVLSEDGIENIALGNEGLGRPYQDFQRFLLMLYRHGVILTVCSKNDIQDVLRVFREHSGMLLREEHIACFQVNWRNKAENIREISEILQIGLDSIVFVDDSVFETEAVRSLLPEVLPICFDRSTVYRDLSCFRLKTEVDITNVEMRNAAYRTDKYRKELFDSSRNFDEYIASLQMSVDIHRVRSDEYARISELTQRANRFTNGKRYTVSEIAECVCKPGFVLYSVYVSDKFSDLGLVGAVGINGAELELFSLSCRALGRNVEMKMSEIFRKHELEDFVFVSTGKNDAVKQFLSEQIPTNRILKC